METEFDKSTIQSSMAEDLFYFCMRLRKDRIRQVVADINTRFPEETLEQRARRVMEQIHICLNLK